MTGKQVYSICGMCTVRCPIQVEVAGNRVKFVQGNPHAAGLEGALCARGERARPSSKITSGPNIP